jgi:hypothetical protein
MITMITQEERDPCPRCCGWVEPTWLVGIEHRRVLTLKAIHCINCGWYGGEPLLDQRAIDRWAAQAAIQLTLRELTA